MPRVFTFWQTHQDEFDFFSFIKTTGKIFAAPFEAYESPSVNAVTIKSLNPNLSGDDSCYLYLGLNDLLDNDAFEFRDTPKSGYYISHLKAPVMVYRRSRLTGPIIGQTSISMYDHFLDEAGLKLVKSAKFKAWTKQALDWLKKRASEKVALNGYAYPATLNAVCLVNSGDTQLTF